MIHDLLINLGFKIRSTGNYGKDQQRVFIDFDANGHAWYWRAEVNSVPVLLSSEEQLRKLVET